MQKTYYPAIDYMKIICAVLVVCIHTGPLLSINQEANFFLVQVAARMAVPFFFIASSFFFFRKLDYTMELRAEKNIEQLKKYSIRLCKMYGLWSLVYLTIQVPVWVMQGFTIKTLLVYLKNFFYAGSYYHLWFIPALIVATFIVYYLLRKMKLKKVIQIAFILYVIGMLINVYSDLLLQIPMLSTVISLYLNVFITARNGIFFGCIYVVFGYILARSETHFTTNRKNAMLLCIGSFVLLVGEVYLIRWMGYMNDLTSMYLMLLPFVYSLFNLLLMIKTEQATVPWIRSSGTLLYFSHCYFTFILGYIPVLSSNSIVFFSVTLILSSIFIVFFLYISKKIHFLRNMI